MDRPSKYASRHHPSSKSVARWLPLSCLAVVAVGAAIAGAFIAVMLPKPILPAREMSESELAVFRDDRLREAQLDESLNILVLGTDNPNPVNRNQAFEASLQGRSDTVLLVRFDPDLGTINVISIPRDTRVRIPNRGVNKINSANAIGGPALTAQIVSSLLGDVPIDRYVRLNTDGIAELIDVLGGVEIDVPTRMRYVDRTQDLEIDLEPGLQRLNGEQAHQFLRFRQDQLGDIGRVQRQQLMMRALSQQAFNPRTLTRLPQIMGTIRDNVDTNMTWEEVLSLFQFALLSKSDRLNMVLLPGRFSRPDEYLTSFWIVDPVDTYRVAVNYFGAEPRFGSPTRSPAQQRVAVTNASGLPRMGRNMANALQQKGFVNVYVTADAPQMLERTEIIAQQGDSQSAAEVQALLGFGEVHVESTGEITSDITVKVGRDWATFWYPEVLEQVQAVSLDP
ncbi:LCP family protein [Synechococcus sp. PCC 7336]|uniref:LCP family protein n=1 Tax=Synechococcus sp. PCC 7336 TaxID=195250 RepID=UPI000345C231|nr:LCP family protein [Synechococcus sp. PCC 7336]